MAKRRRNWRRTTMRYDLQVGPGAERLFDTSDVVEYCRKPLADLGSELRRELPKGAPCFGSGYAVLGHRLHRYAGELVLLLASCDTGDTAVEAFVMTMEDLPGLPDRWRTAAEVFLREEGVLPADEDGEG